MATLGRATPLLTDGERRKRDQAGVECAAEPVGGGTALLVDAKGAVEDAGKVAGKAITDVIMGTKKGTNTEAEKAEIDKLWLRYKLDGSNEFDSEDPDKSIDISTFGIFGGVQFAPGGGISEVRNLWEKEKGGARMAGRSFWATVMVLFVLYNTYFLIDNDFIKPHVTQKFGDWINGTLVCDEDEGGFLMTILILDVAYPILTFNIWGPVAPTIFSCNGAMWLGLFEIVYLAILYFRLITNFLVSSFPTVFARMVKDSNGKIDTHHAHRVGWFHLYAMYWETIPAISTCSGMKLLQSFQPLMLTNDLFHLMYVEGPRTKYWFLYVLKWILFICYRGGALLIGFDMFIRQLRNVTDSALQHRPQPSDLLNIFVFINQVLGIVSVDIAIRSRLFLFIFGGEQSEMSPEQHARRKIWEALVAREVYTYAYKQPKKTLKAEPSSFCRCYLFWKVIWWLKYQIIMLSFSDEDFQKVVLTKDLRHTLWSFGQSNQ